VEVESLIPEGAPAVQEVTVGEAKLGQWDAVTVRVQGRGDYSGLMALLGKVSEPEMPVRLDYFSLRSACAGEGSVVSFDLVLSVFERHAEAA